jgi:fatty-acyl-CoA synthase
LGCRTRSSAKSSARESALRDGATAGAAEIRAFCQGRIAHYKIPRYIKFVDGFPMTVTGKIQKFAMREQMMQELGLSLQKTA